MNFEIVPYVGAGCIKLGMERAEIRKCFNNIYRESKKSSSTGNTSDVFDCCYVYYKEQDTCEAIEFFGEAQATIDGKIMLGEPYSRVKNMFEAIDNSISFGDSGFTSFKYGVGVYAPFAQDEPDEPVESVIVFEKGYYD